MASPAFAQEAPTVVAIRFEGNKRYDDKFLKEQIATKVGEPRDNGLLTRDSRILRRFFASVLDIDEKEVKGEGGARKGVEIIFYVLDQSLVGDVKVVGSSIEKSEYEPLLATRRRRPLLDYSLAADKDMLIRLHREKGYYFVSVQVDRKPGARPNMEDVLFTIIPNSQVKVTDLIIEGAHSIPLAKLLKPLESPGWATKRKVRNLAKPVDGSLLTRVVTAPYYWIASAFNSSYYKQSTVQDDRRRLEATYQQEGFLDVRVVLVGVKFDAKRKRAQVHYRVEEGPRYAIRKVKIEYAEGGLPDEADRVYLGVDKLDGLSMIFPGSPYRFADVDATKRSIQERLWGRAYAQSTVNMEVRPAGQAKEVDVRYVIKAGSKVRLGQIRIIGNRYTRDNVIRRQFRDGAEPGDFLDIKALQAGMQRLNSLRYFRFVRFGRRTQFGLVPSVTGRPGEYDVEVVVDELDKTRTLEIGGSVDTDGGAIFRLDVSWRNFDWKKPPKRIWDILDPEAFRGGGQTFTVSLQPGTRNSQFSISWSDPRINDSAWGGSTRLYRAFSTETPDYNLTTDGLLLRVGRWLDDQFRWRVSVEWDLRQVLLDDPAPNAPVNALDQQGTSSMNGIILGLRRVARQEQYSFLVGHTSSVNAAIYGLGADIEIFKVHFDHAMGWKLWRTTKGYQRLQVRFAADWATTYGSTSEVPIWERYFLGGRSLRGFEFREVGPRSNGRPTGGDFRVTLSIEYQIPLLGSEDGVGIDLAFFIDQGGLSDSIESWNSDSWRVGAGFGFAISFELGGGVQPPLFVYFGWPIVKQPEDRKRLVTISFVRSF